jgi:RNase H-like domain found in reverse transcriptase/Integrase zinc binding domain
MDPVKTNAVKTWPVPTNKRELQQFLGFCNYYRKFIEGFSKLSNPLQLLVGKNDWNWTDLQQNAFEGLCSKLSNGPMLALPNNSDPYRIHSDASLLASGAVLEQLQEDKWKVIAYTSKSFSPAERNYNTADRELLAIIHALKDWYHLLHSSPHKTKIFTDNRAITFFRQPQNLSYRHARWATYLSDFNIVLKSIKGSANIPADGLSRRYSTTVTADDNKNLVLLPLQFLEEPHENKLRSQRNNPIRIDSSDRESIDQILSQAHNTPTGAHPGIHIMMEQIQRHYTWSNIKRDVTTYVKGCARCQQTKVDHTKRKAPLYPLPAPNYPWEIISVDLIVPLPDSKGYDAIMVVVDSFTKMKVLLPTTTHITAKGVALLFRTQVFKRFGMPTKIISD